MALTFGTTKDQSARWIRALVYGPSGIGKTTSAKTLPPDRTLIVSFERKLLPLAGIGFPCTIINDWQEVEELVDMFATGEPVRIDGKEIKTIFIDSLTSMGELAKTHVLKKARPELYKRKTKGRSEAPENIYDDQMEQPDWAKYNSIMCNAIVKFTALPCNIIFTALEREGEGSSRRLMLDGKTGKMANSFFDLVFYMREIAGEPPRRVFQTDITFEADLFAKGSGGVLDLYEEANWAHVMRKLHDAQHSTGKEAG